MSKIIDKKVKSSLENLHIPTWNELPNIDLYLDQVVTLVNTDLSPYIFFNNDNNKDNNLVLSKTMINNYVKNNLIDAPIKKKYGKVQLAKLFVICVLKQVYSMNDIKSLITVALEGSDIAFAYNQFCRQFKKALNCTINREDFIDIDSASNDNKYLLKSVLLSCSYKIYTNNVLNNLKENY